MIIYFTFFLFMSHSQTWREAWQATQFWIQFVFKKTFVKQFIEQVWNKRKNGGNLSIVEGTWWKRKNHLQQQSLSSIACINKHFILSFMWLFYRWVKPTLWNTHRILKRSLSKKDAQNVQFQRAKKKLLVNNSMRRFNTLSCCFQFPFLNPNYNIIIL